VTTGTGAVQLVLPITGGTDDELRAQADGLAELSGALHLLLAVADGRLHPSATSLGRVRDALDVIARFAPGGRLGHVVRRFRDDRPGRRRWSELAAELDFATSLCTTGGAR
jgi:hypothetical protein